VEARAVPGLIRTPQVVGVAALVFLLTAIPVVLSGCAPTRPPPAAGAPTLYDRLETNPVDASGFEATIDVDPEGFLPPELVSGPHHVVAGVWNDGFTNRYLLVTEFGSFEIETTGLLRKRIHEVEVISSLDAENVSANKVYLLSTANAARGPVEGAAQWIFHPVKSAKDVPSGMWSYARRLVALAERDRTFQEDHYTEELIGFSDAKREWAYRLGVDVYSENALLQQRLDRYAWLSLSGGLTVRVPLMAVCGPAGYALTASGTTDQMRRELRDRSPEEIRLDVRRRLEAMEVDEELAERFVAHPWYPPTRLLVITESLSLLDGARGRDRFIEAAVQADEPQETYLFTRLAIMLAIYAEQEAEVAEVSSAHGLVMARTSDGGLVVPLYLDWALWTEPMGLFVEAIEESAPADVSSKRLLVSGWLSPLVHERLEDRGWQVLEGVETSWLADIDRAARQPGQPDPNRVLPEFGEQ